MSKLIKTKKKLIFKRILFILMLTTTFYIIFNFSAQDAEESGSISQKVTEIIVKIIAKIKTMDITTQLYWIKILHPIVRKLAHFGIYTAVGFSIMGLMCTFDIRNILKVITSFCVGVTYAITDEVHQYFIPGRNASMADIFIDSLGVLTGIFILITLIVFSEAIANWIKR